MAGFDIDTSKLHAGLDMARARVHEGAGNGLSQLAERILTAAKAAAPKDSGELAGSGRTAVDFGNLEAKIGFGADSEPVNAIVQHERMDYRHDDGGPKYLEIPFVAIGAGEGGAIIARAIEAQL